MISFWEKEYYQYDIAIIGGGLTGINLSISLMQKKPGLRVIVLDKDLFPSSASTRNAGFACFGSPSELISDLDSMGLGAMLDLVERRYKGLEIIRTRLNLVDIDYENKGGYEILDSSREHLVDQLDKINHELKSLFKKEVFTQRNDLIGEFGFNKNWCSKLVFNPMEGQLHPGKLLWELEKKASQLGVIIKRGFEVSNFVDNKSHIEIVNEKLKIKAERLAICNNAWAGKILGDESVRPGRGTVLLTNKLDLSFEGTFHAEEGFFYFRDLDGKLLIGGGRNYDIENEESFEIDVNPNIEKSILEKCELILNGKKFIIEDRWSGIMGFGDDKLPVVKKISDQVWAAYKMSGMGVALSGQIGEELSDEIIA